MNSRVRAPLPWFLSTPPRSPLPPARAQVMALHQENEALKQELRASLTNPLAAGLALPPALLVGPP